MQEAEIIPKGTRVQVQYWEGVIRHFWTHWQQRGLDGQFYTYPYIAYRNGVQVVSPLYEIEVDLNEKRYNLETPWGRAKQVIDPAARSGKLRVRLFRDEFIIRTEDETQEQQ